MYFIEEGFVSIKMNQNDGGEKEISRLEKGQYFGELALVTHKPRAASAYAQDNVKIACKYQISTLKSPSSQTAFHIYLQLFIQLQL
jgi:hypothetical protein